MTSATLCRKLAYSAVLMICAIPSHSLHAHGIAGNRYFPATSTFDDPAVADEISFNWSRFNKGYDSTSEADYSGGISAARLLSDKWAIGFDYEKDSFNQPPIANAYKRKNDVYLKTLLHRDDLNEELLSVSIGYGFSHTDLPGYGVNSRNSVFPSIAGGKGFGNVSDRLSWMRPFALVGAASFELPIQKTTHINGLTQNNQSFLMDQSQNVNNIHWGFAIEYSTLFLSNSFVRGRLPDAEPLHQFVPLVEFAFDSNPTQKTTGTMNPGLSYVEQTWQLLGEFILPLDHGPPSTKGFRLQLMVFLDDLVPSLFGAPLIYK